MTTGGYTSQGFIGLTIQEVTGNLNVAVLANVDPALDTSSDQPVGQLIGSFAEQLSTAWGVLGVLYNILNPAAAEGPPLYAIGAITGCYPQQATYSTVVANATLAAGASLPANTAAWVVGQPTNLWYLESGITNSGSSPAAISGTWKAATAGPVQCNPGTLTQFTSTSGWSALTNPAGANVGLAADTDTTFRIRRVQTLAAGGSSTVDAIEASVDNVEGVVTVNVFENTDTTPDANGVPPGGIHAIVWAGVTPTVTNDQIAQAIWNRRGGGTPTYGAQTGVAIDKKGRSRTMSFDFATQLPTYVNLQSAQTASLTAGQQAAIQTAIATYFATLTQGKPVVKSAIDAAVWALGIYSGSPTYTLGFSASPAGTSDLTVPQLEIATIPPTGGPYITFS